MNVYYLKGHPFGAIRQNWLLTKIWESYQEIVKTCKMCGVSTKEYFKEFFKAIRQGRTDYENMLPMPIGIKIIKAL